MVGGASGWTGSVAVTVPSSVIASSTPTGAVIGAPPSPSTTWPLAVEMKPDWSTVRSPLRVNATWPFGA